MLDSGHQAVSEPSRRDTTPTSSGVIGLIDRFISRPRREAAGDDLQLLRFIEGAILLLLAYRRWAET